MDREPHLKKKLADMKCQRVDEPSVPSLEDEAIEVEHVFAEPKSDYGSADGFLSVGKENAEKRLKMEDFSSTFDYGWKVSYGGLDFINTGGGEDDLKLEVLDGLLDEVDEVDDIHAAHDLSIPCEDFLLDIDFPENLSKLEYGPNAESHLGNSSSESHSPGFSGSSNSAAGVSEFSIATVQESYQKNSSLGKAIGCELHHDLGTNCLCQAPVLTASTLCLTEHPHGVNESDDEKPLVSLIVTNKKGRGTTRMTKGEMLLEQKRLRRPTQRYVEEFSKNSASCMKGKFQVTSEPPLVMSETRVRRGRPRKNEVKPAIESDYESSGSDSDTHKSKRRSKMGGDRRKHQRMWTLSEVIKLVDGISQYGVGRWTDIKRLLFASSAYRTPVDLRDKWRNLLRSSCAHKPNKRGVKEDPKHAVRPLPKTVIYRIQELANLHPYPRVRCPNNSCDEETSTKLSETTKGASFSPRGRNLRRKKCT